MSEAIKIICGRRIRKIDLSRNPGVDITSRMIDEMVSSVAQDAIERIRRAGSKFVRILDAVPFRDDEIMIEVAAAIIPIGELAFGDFNGDTRKDMFYRADSGQWWVISPGIYDWTPLESSGVPRSGLKLPTSTATARRT